MPLLRVFGIDLNNENKLPFYWWYLIWFESFQYSDTYCASFALWCTAKMLYSRVLLASFRSMRYWLLFALVHFENLITVYCLFENILNTIILRCLKCPIQYWSCAIATCARLQSRPFATFIRRIQQWLFTFPCLLIALEKFNCSPKARPVKQFSMWMILWMLTLH